MKVRELFSPRLLVEMVVIVVGVLLALAADRWNQGRSDRELEAVYLERFVADIRGDSVSAEAYLASFPGIVSATDSLLSFVEGSERPPSLASTALRAFQPFYMPAAPTWNEVLNASSLGLVRDVRVRELLSGYYGSERPLVELNLARSDRRGRDPFMDVLYPMGLFLPCTPGQECALPGLGLDGSPDNASTYRRLDPMVFREWPGIRELLVGLGSHHGAQRLFAQALADAAGEALCEVEAAR